jgi:hypothetical protein
LASAETKPDSSASEFSKKSIVSVNGSKTLLLTRLLMKAKKRTCVEALSLAEFADQRLGPGGRRGNCNTAAVFCGVEVAALTSCWSRSLNSRSHIMLCARETAAEQYPRSFLSGSSQNQCMQLEAMQKLPR